MVMNLRGIGRQVAVLILVAGLIGGSAGAALLENTLGTATREVGGTALAAGPSVVGTSTTGSAVAGGYHSAERVSFFAKGRFWVFYHDGTYLSFKSSTDGASWTSAATVTTKTASYWDFCLDPSGNFVHCVWSDANYGVTGYLYYKRGSLNTDGTISWGSEYQVWVPGSGYQTRYHSITVDSDGYPWIVTQGHHDESASGNGKVFKSARNDGVWQTASGFPLDLGRSAYCQNIILSLTAGKMYVIYSEGESLYGRAIINNALQSEEPLGTMVNRCLFSAVAIGDDVHLVYTNSAKNIVYKKRTWGTNWGSEVTVQSSVTSTTAPALSVYGTIDLICFWLNAPTSNHVYYKKCISGTWDATPTDWIDESAFKITDGRELSSWITTYSYKVGLVYLTKTESPYSIKFAYLEVPSNRPPNAPILNSPAANYRFNPSASVTFTWTFSDPDSGDSQSAYQLQIAYDSAFTSLYLDTGKVTSASTSTSRTIPSTIGAYYWRVKTWDAAGAEGAWSSGRTIIVDRIKVNSLTADDVRRDVGSTVTLTVQLVYEYDSGYISSGSFTLNGLTLSYTGSDGYWRATDTKSTVQAVTYNSVSGTDGLYWLTAVNMNGQSTTVIWDRIKIVEGGVTDVDTKTGGKVWYKAVYEYDGVAFTGGTLYLNGQPMAFEGDRWTYAFPYQMSGNQAVFHITGVSDPIYGLTVINSAVGDIVLNWATAQVTINKP